MRRRPFLRATSTIAVVSLAGCTSLLPTGGSTNHDPRANDLTVINERSEPVVADIVVALPDGETVESSRHRFPPGETTLEDLAEYGTYELTVAVDGMPARSHPWNANDCNHLTVEVQADEVVFREGTC